MILKTLQREGNLLASPVQQLATLVSVDWKGYLYDCDFNQMLDLPIDGQNARLHISELQDSDLFERSAKTANHCFGCTSGCGSSCNGSLT